MDTIKFSTNEEDIRKAGSVIRAGGLVAFPTETVYGLGADALNAEAVASVYKAKGRPSDNPMIVHIADAEGLYGLIEGGRSGVSADVSLLMDSLWPGPLTMIFRKDPGVPDVTTGGLDTVAVRMPSNETARRLIKESGCPIAAPSANLSGKPSPTTAEDVLEDMNGRIDGVIMGEQCDVGIESTVLDLTGDEPRILRPGYITKEKLSELLGEEVIYDQGLTRDHSGSPEDEDFHPRSPGMKYKHYSPNAKVRIIEGSEEDFGRKAREIALDAKNRGQKTAVIDYGGDAARAAHRLFADLRELDRQGCDLVLIRALSDTGFGFSVMNRMLRSAGYDVVK